MSISFSIDSIEEGNDWKMRVPTQGLASQSVALSPKNRQTKDSSPAELFTLMQKVARFWEQKGITNYLVYTSIHDSGWEMVPYEGKSTSLWSKICAFSRQIVVLYRVTFGRYALSAQERQRVYQDYRNISSVEVKNTAEKVQQVATDAFCQPKIIDAQQIWEGKYIRVLYDYKPLGSEKLHFLLVPKIHKERFTELSQEEFEEMQAFARQLIQHYPGHLCYQYHKTGKLAGQTVPHFHQHLVFVLPPNEFTGKLSVFFRMIGWPQPLPPDQLKEKVSELQKQLQFSPV